MINVSADIMKATSVAYSSVVMARRHVWLWDWKADFSEKTSLTKLPLEGKNLFCD